MSNNPGGEDPDLSELLHIEFDWRRHDREILRMKIGYLQRYAQAIEKFISEQAQEIENDLQKPSTGRSDNEIIDLCDELDELKEVFPKILRYSLFVYSYSWFEKTLLRIADDYRHRRQLALKPTDLYDKGITRAKTYLTKIVGISFPDKEPSWQNILLLNDIRSQIVHNEGDIPKNHTKKSEMQKLVNAWNHDESLDNCESFEFSEKFIFHVLDTFNTFLTSCLHTLWIKKGKQCDISSRGKQGVRLR